MEAKNKETKVVIRLNYEQYQQLERQIGKVTITNNTSPYEVSFQLGVQFVLKVLREGYVTGEPKDTDKV